MRWTGHVARMGEEEKSIESIVYENLTKIKLRRPRGRRKFNI
jgi:hypothetical protein